MIIFRVTHKLCECNFSFILCFSSRFINLGFFILFFPLFELRHDLIGHREYENRNRNIYYDEHQVFEKHLEPYSDVQLGLELSLTSKIEIRCTMNTMRY